MGHNAIRYNGRVGSTSNNEHGFFTIPEFCPEHGEHPQGGTGCYCTKQVGDGEGEIPYKVAEELVALGSFEWIDEPSPIIEPPLIDDDVEDQSHVHPL